jgi:hypothetical protein
MWTATTTLENPHWGGRPTGHHDRLDGPSRAVDDELRMIRLAEQEAANL